MIPLYADAWFTFRFAEARQIPRVHLEGIEPGRRVAVHRADPTTLRPLALLVNAVAGTDGWVEFAEPLLVRVGDVLLAIPEPGAPRSLCEGCAWVRSIVTPKGSRFLLCQLAQADPAYAKYPPQPVRRCGGFTEMERGTGDK